MEGTGEGCGFLCSLKLPYLSTMSQQFCRRLWAPYDKLIEGNHHNRGQERKSLSVIQIKEGL